MNGDRQPAEFPAWNALSRSFRRGLEDCSDELPPPGFATAVVARWKADRDCSSREYGALEWISIRLALVSALAALAVWAGWLWNSRAAPGEEWLDLPVPEEVGWW